MKGIGDILAADITVSGDRKVRRAVERHRHTMRLLNLLQSVRGRQDGHQLEDWLRAEQELVRHYV